MEEKRGKGGVGGGWEGGGLQGNGNNDFMQSLSQGIFSQEEQTTRTSAVLVNIFKDLGKSNSK